MAKSAMPRFSRKASSRFTSAMTSGPMPSPASRSNLCVGMRGLDIGGIRGHCHTPPGPMATGASEELRMPQQRPHVVIVGAGFGGLQAAKMLGRAAVDITIIDRHNYHC